MRDGGVGKKLAVAHKHTIEMRCCRRQCESPCPFSRSNCWFYVFLAMSDYLSGVSEITEARYTAKLRVNNVTCGDSFRVDAAECTLKPDSHDEISLAIFCCDFARAAKA